MKKAGLILVVCLLIASCGGKQKETVNTNNITVDTLRVDVIILKGVAIDKVIDMGDLPE